MSESKRIQITIATHIKASIEKLKEELGYTTLTGTLNAILTEAADESVKDKLLASSDNYDIVNMKIESSPFTMSQDEYASIMGISGKERDGKSRAQNMEERKALRRKAVLKSQQAMNERKKRLGRTPVSYEVSGDAILAIEKIKKVAHGSGNELFKKYSSNEQIVGFAVEFMLKNALKAGE